ncbi:hypothetical protein AZL_023150 [Azospirillum sp. B510]|nr:hypothetical protein AZL_023150 [Azospirillum sp. B510]
MADPSTPDRSPDPSPGDPPSYESLARRYLDLWQDQWTACAADPEMADMMTRLFQMMGQGVAPFGPGPAGFGFAGGSMAGTGWDPRPGPFPNTGTPQHGRPSDERASGGRQPGGRDSAPPADAAGAASAGPASDGGSGQLAQLLDRIAALEERLASLVAGPAGAGGGAQGGHGAGGSDAVGSPASGRGGARAGRRRRPPGPGG